MPSQQTAFEMDNNFLKMIQKNVIVNYTPGPTYRYLPPECTLLLREGVFHSLVTGSRLI